jgi:hypothetical protein
MRSEMFFPKTDSVSGIISKDKPESHDHKKKIVLSREIEDYQEVSDFITENNKMSSGNYTLLPIEQIKTFEKLNCLNILMRGENKKLYGTIFSIPLPIQSNQEIITHGCTSFLNIHNKLRGFNMCSILIKELASYGHEKNIFCSYQLSSFKMCHKSFPISSWYRPINLLKCLGLGFTFPGYNEIKQFTNNKILYKCKTPKGYSVKKVKNIKQAYNFYISMIKDKKFAFYPDLSFFENWTKQISTYLVKFDKNIVGIFSITDIYCKMSIEGKLCLPLIFNSLEDHKTNVLKCLLSIAEEKQCDVLYTYCVGDLNENLLKSVNSIKTREDSWFSIYNNNIDLTSSDLYIPLI